LIEKDYTVIMNMRDYVAALKHIEDSTYLAFDTETTGLNTRKDKVIGFSFSGEEGTAFYYPIKKWSTEYNRLVDHSIGKNLSMSILKMDLLTMLEKKELIMFNGSFDIRIVKNNFGIDLTDSLVADAMLMKHTCDEEKPFGLKAIAVKIQDKLGLDIEKEANEEAILLKENVKKNGGETKKTNYEMYKADLGVMGPYACADADLTLRIANYYQGILEEEGLLDFFFEEEVMPLYKEVTIPMEEHGVKLNLELIEKLESEISADIHMLESAVLEELFSTDAANDWYTNRVEVAVNETPTGAYAQGVAYYYDLPLPRTAGGKYQLSKKVKEALPESEAKEFLLGNISNLDQETQFKIKENIFFERNEKKLNVSANKQLGDIVFNYMGIKPLSRTPKGSPQFNATMIQHIIEEYDFQWAKSLSNYNKLVKIKGAYIDRFLDNHEDGYYYFSYKQHGTISGRYSSDAQQLPRPKEEGEQDPLILNYTNAIRKFFISGEGRSFIDADYESLEPHVFAHVSGDEDLIDIFRKGHDFYSTIAIATEGLEGYSADKKADNYLGLLNKPLRQTAKEYSLGVPYGMGGYALAKKLGIETEEGEDLVENYLNAYPDLEKWMKASKSKAQMYGMIKTESGRIRHLPKVKALYKRHKDALLSFKYRQKMMKKYGKEEIDTMFEDYKNGVNNSKNVQIQGLSASIVNKAAIEINRYFRNNNIDAWVCAQVHDQLITNCPSELAEEMAKVVQDKMENTTKLSLDIKAPPCIADNWGDSH